MTTLAAAAAAARAIPPVWPLATSVAVNPYLGQSGEGLAAAAARLARVAGAPVTMPRAWYHARIAAGEITDADLAAALGAVDPAQRPPRAALLAPGEPVPAALPTVAELAAQVSGIDWPAIIDERFGVWAGSFFDAGQALWAAPTGRGAYLEWRAVATHDLTPEILGLRGFAAFVAAAPDAAPAALARAVADLGVDGDALATYFHRLLVTLGGWAQAARYQRWQAELAGGSEATLTDFLTIRLLWEAALFAQYRPAIATRWAATVAAHAAPLEPTAAQIVDAVLQEARERASQRRLAATLAGPAPRAAARPAIQAAFCIDVRSEVFRRALEATGPDVQTLGFAGFFGLAAAHRRFASDVVEKRLPVLLNPGLDTRAGGAPDADRAARVTARAARAWGRFKLAAVSSFAFVEATGPVYLAKLVRDALGLSHGRDTPEPAPHPVEPADDVARIAAAAGILRAMSLTQDFAPIVLIVGHGATTANNPHASALHCGACGGFSGEVNARLLAALLNDVAVRAGLETQGVAVPAGTCFVAACHDTTTDTVTLYPDDPATPDLAVVRARLAAAGVVARTERALRLPRAAGTTLAHRSRDWSETRPEWGLAGCRAFIAAPRALTAGRDLAGTAFLHDYDWRADAGFGVLTLILTAPVVVASWISLQYYGSSVAPDLFGGGNKLLHNVIGGIGVVEGNGGPLRAGLPWQSVADGRGLVHEPLRLTVAVAAPRAAIGDILAAHPDVVALFDNRWLHLIALDDDGAMNWRYVSGGAWEAFAETTPVREVVAA